MCAEGQVDVHAGTRAGFCFLPVQPCTLFTQDPILEVFDGPLGANRAFSGDAHKLRRDVLAQLRKACGW